MENGTIQSLNCLKFSIKFAHAKIYAFSFLEVSINFVFLYLISIAGEYWNGLPRVLQDICDINQFKMQVKKFIHGASFNDVAFIND